MMIFGVRHKRLAMSMPLGALGAGIGTGIQTASAGAFDWPPLARVCDPCLCGTNPPLPHEQRLTNDELH
jgi:uncharacterized Zn-binding protein involved in type VI secretion